MKILVISSTVGLFKPKSGSRNRFYNLVTQLIKKGGKATVLQPSRYKESIDDALAEVYYYRVNLGNRTFGTITDLNIGFIMKFAKIIKKQKIDIIQVNGNSGVISSKLVTKLLRNDTPIIYDAHNVQSDISKYISNDPKISFLEKIFALIYTPLQERIAVKCADHIISVSHEDRMRFIEKYGINEKKVTVIPSGVNIIDLTLLKDKDKIRNELGIDGNKLVIIFHGSYFYLPNREAMDLIINHIASKIRKSNPNVIFVIAGLDVPLFEKDNIKSIGFVEDIYSLLYAADIAIVPILGGGGTRLKILDYMGVGLPIVTTKKGIEGINAKNNEHAIVVDDVNEGFIDAISLLINNKEERKRIGANARKLAEEEYDWEKIGEKLDKLYRRILEERKNANI